MTSRTTTQEGDTVGLAPAHPNPILQTDDQGFWYCPVCKKLRTTRHQEALKARGYAMLAASIDKDMLDRWYGKDTHMNHVFFKNIIGHSQCQNKCEDGLDGSACTFTCENIRGPVERAKEDTKLGYCSLCAVTPKELEMNPERSEYIQNNRQGVGRFDRWFQDPWGGQRDMYVRPFVYDIEDNSLKCPSKRWGAGNNQDTKLVHCPGRYGDPICFYIQSPDRPRLWEKKQWPFDKEEEAQRDEEYEAEDEAEMEGMERIEVLGLPGNDEAESDRNNRLQSVMDRFKGFGI